MSSESLIDICLKVLKDLAEGFTLDGFGCGVKVLHHVSRGSSTCFRLRYFTNYMTRNTVRSCLSSLVVCAFVSTLSGCGPRGESRTVDELLSDARSSYQSVYSKTSAVAQGNLKSLASSLDRISGLGGGGDARQVAGDIANALTELNAKAGYTVRPAMTELISQYRTVSERTDAAVSIGAANLKLLAARTYALISNELNTTQFRL